MKLKNKVTRTVFYSYIAIVGIFALIRLLSTLDVLNITGVWSYILNASIQIGLMFAIPVCMFCFRHKQKPKETFKFFGYKKISFKAICIAILMGIIVYILNIFVSSFFTNLISAFGWKEGSSGGKTPISVGILFVNLLCTAVLPAICEETAHRGLLLKGLGPLGRKRAIIISSMLFGLAHMNIQQFFYATLIGFLLGYLASVCDSIYPAMIIHFMNNALSTLMSFSYNNDLNWHFIHNFLNANLTTRPVIAILFSLALIGLCSVLLWLLIKALFRETAKKRAIAMQEGIFKELTKQTYLNELQEVADGNTNLPTRRSVSFEEYDAIYQKKGVELGFFTKLEEEIMFDEEQYKMDKVTNALMITCLALASAVTLFTLIWGILL